MNLVVLNGSPKGNISVTMQFVEYLGLKIPGASLNILNIAKEIRGIERRPEKLRAVLDAVRRADLLLLAYPVYYMTVPSSYMRFWELAAASDEARAAFAGKRVGVFTTSIHFFDHTSHEYMRAVCDRLEMLYVGGFSAHMQDLTTEGGREKLRGFAARLTASEAGAWHHSRRYRRHGAPAGKMDLGEAGAHLDNTKTSVLVVADASRADSGLPAMIDRFSSNFVQPPRVVWLESLGLVSGCTGCLACAMDLRCVFTEKDGHRRFVDEELTTADIVVFASDIDTCFFTSRWQAFLTRLFFNGHVPLIKGKQMGVLASGPLSDYPHIRSVFDGFMGYSGNHLLDYVSDEAGEPHTVGRELDNLATALLEAKNAAYFPPPRFDAVSAHKLFRDEIFSHLGVVFQHDHQYFCKNGLYDFPTAQLGRRVLNRFLYLLLKTPGLRRRFYTREMVPGMVRPYSKVLERARLGRA